MLLNTATSQASPASTSMAADGVGDVVRAPAAPITPPQGRALLAALEHLAQRELVALAAAQPVAAAPTPDAAFAALAWDLGLSGNEVESTASLLGT
jgi:ribosomal protein L12E/L44/L45/RPP1/RPP2